MANLTVSFNFIPGPPWLPWQRNLGYNSACIGDFCEIFAPIKGFSGMGHRLLPIAMPTKFETKLSITR